MVSSRAETIPEYLKSLPKDRRDALSAVRRAIKKRLPKGYKEAMQYGMIGYAIPLSKYPDTYNGQPLAVAALASQKNYMSLYLMSVYADPKLLAWFTKAYKASGKKLDMGKSCVRFRSLDDLPLDVISEAISKVPPEDLIAIHNKTHGKAAKKRAAKKKTAKKKAAKKKTAKKKTPVKKAAKKTTKRRARR